MPHCTYCSYHDNLVLRWQHEKADVYARHILENMELLAQFDEAERAGDVDKLAFCVRSLIVQAASSRAVGMSAQARSTESSLV